MLSKTAYWFASICACIIVVIGIGMLAIPTVATILLGSILAVIGMVIITHMFREKTYILWIGR